MKKIIVEAGQARYIDLSAEEEAEVLARARAGEEAERKSKERASKIDAARQRVLADPKMADLAVALGMREPE